jgi:hypothetical protein
MRSSKRPQTARELPPNRSKFAPEPTQANIYPSVRWWQLLALVLALADSVPALNAQTTILWQDDFESPTVWDNWGVENGVWDIGAPLTGPPTNSAGWRAHQPTNCAATVLNGNYPASTSSRLIRITPFVVPSTSQNPRLEFWHWYQFSGNSYGVVQVYYTNTWTDLSPRYYGTGSAVWTRPVVDLRAYAGKAIQIAFRIVADGNVADGWDVDEVRMIKGDYRVPDPGFELGMGDWYAETGTWEVGVPTSGPATNALGLRAHSGSNCLATVLAGNYQENQSGRFVSPPLVVPAVTDNPRLRFWHWWNFSYLDFGQVQISTNNGVTWQALSDRYGDDGSGGYTFNYWSCGRWTQAWLDLTPYAGQTVRLSFYFYAHYLNSSDTPGAGWYVDDLVLEAGPLPPFLATDGFEDAGALDRWTADHGVWEIGVPTAGPATNALGQRAHGGTHCLVTLLPGKYYDNTWSRVASAPFVVPQPGEHPSLRFWYWFSFSSGDFGELQIKRANGNWTPLTTYSGTMGPVWSRTPPFDLSPYSGQTVQIGFYFYARDAVGGDDTSTGWYIDDLTVTSVIPPTGIVEFTDARYFINEAETNAVISVVRRYGSAGSASVTFWATDGTAVSPDDYDAVVEQIDWADGEQGVKTVMVPIHQDALIEGPEIVSLQLIVPGPLASSVARESATLVIIDDDGGGPLVTNIAHLRSLVGTTNWVPTNTTSLFTVEGTVTTYTNLSSTAPDELFFMQDGTNGIAVLYRGGTNDFMPQSGDRLRVTASLTNLNGLLALAPNYANLTSYVWRLSAGNSLPTPAALDFAARTNVPVMEAMEARYVIVTNVMISQSGGGFFPTVLTNILVTNQAGLTFNLTMHPNLTNAGQAKPITPVAILGVLTQNDPTAPYTTNYALLPTLIDAPPQPRIEWCGVSSIVQLESGPAITLWACRSNSSIGDVRASFGTVNGTAIAGADYLATNGEFFWADGDMAPKSCTVGLVDDSAEESDEVFTVGLSGLALGSNTTAFITIVNDDFVARPWYQVVLPGTTASVSVVPTAHSEGFQWWKDGAPKPDATNATLTMTNVQTNDAGNYWCLITTTAGAATSTVAQLEVAEPVVITNQPAGQLQCQTTIEGSQVTLCVGVSGTRPITYQWRFNGSPIADGTNECLILNNVQPNQSGDYSVVVNNIVNQPATSSNATLTVIGGGFVPRGEGMGDYTNVGGCFVVSGSGEDIEGTEDRFFMLNTEWVGDGQIVAQITSFAPENPLSEAGVMFRDGYAGGDRHVLLAMNANNRTVFRRRANANYDSVENWHHGTNTAWLRLMRMGETFVGHYSTNGANWELVWWTTIPNLPNRLMSGLAVTAHRNTGSATATFCNVCVGGLTPIPGAWPEAGPRIWVPGEPAASPPMSQFGGFKMLIGGAVGDVFAVKASSDIGAPFSAWLSVGTVTNTYGVVPFTDAQALTRQLRFYRLQRVGP